MMAGSTDVLICGAGAAGLTMAIDLARRGVRFVLIDKLPSSFQGSRGKGIQPRTQEIFEDLGILDRAMAAGGIYPTVRRYTADGSHVDQEVVNTSNPTPAEPYHLPLMVPQFKTEAVMRERLIELGHSPEYGVELTRIAVGTHGIEAVLSTPNGERILHARYLVGADGGRSFVRSALGIGFPGKTLGVRAIVADVVLEGLSRDRWHQFNGEAGPMAICPLAGTALFQIQAPVPLEGDIDLSAAALTERVAQQTGRADIIVQSVAWSSLYTMGARLADRYRNGPAFLVGDAAHVHPPTGGQGLNTSVQDAYNLGWKLAAVLAGAPETLLDTYEAERRPLAADVLGLSTRLLEGFKNGDNRRPREAQQLDIGYPSSPLSCVGRYPAGNLAPGARAPDALVQGAAGSPTRLFMLFKGTHWTLLVNGPSTVAPRAGLHIHSIGPGLEMEDHLGHFAQFYGLHEQASALIRPDGYLAGTFAKDELAALQDHLEQYCYHQAGVFPGQ